MVSERSKDAIPTARGFLNHVDLIGRVVSLSYLEYSGTVTRLH